MRGGARAGTGAGRAARRAPAAAILAATTFLLPGPPPAEAKTERPGRVFIFSGATGLLIRAVDAPDPRKRGWFGASLAGIGDTDADGVPDLAVGAPRLADSGLSSAGMVYVFSGADGTLLLSVASPDPGRKARFGWSLAPAGDVDADGAGDFVAGSPSARPPGQPRSGGAWLLSGNDGSVLSAFVPPVPYADSQFGYSLAAGGDADGDGMEEVLVGAPKQRVKGRREQGRVHHFDSLGTPLGYFDDPERQADARFGASLSFMPDTDGDGFDEILVGADGQHVFSGDYSGGVFILRATDPSDPVIGMRTARPPSERANFGFAVAGLPDLNGDGMGDLAATAPDQTGSASLTGGAWTVSGEPDNPATNDDSIYVLLQVDDPEPHRFALFGGALAALGDLTGDGLPELLIGSELHRDGAGFRSGRAYVIEAASGGLLFTVPSPTGDSCSRFGWSVASVGDVDGDSVSDFAVGAPRHRTAVRSIASRCF